jgi:uncharacterized protein
MRIRVTPSAKRDEAFLRGGVLCVKVSCPPEDGKANRRASEVLSKAFGCKVTIVSGQKSRDKEIEFGCGKEKISLALKELEEKSKSKNR